MTGVLKVGDLPARAGEVRLQLIECGETKRDRGVALDLHFMTNVYDDAGRPLLYSLTTYQDFATRNLFGYPPQGRLKHWFQALPFKYKVDGGRLVFPSDRGRWCFDRGMIFRGASAPPAPPKPKKVKRLTLPPPPPPPDVFDPPPVQTPPRPKVPASPGARNALSLLRDDASEEELSSARQRLRDDLKTLNPVQLEAALHEGGPLLVLAGAGAGKTKTLAAKVGYLVLEKGLSPRSLFVTTFTKKAGEELVSRMGRYLSPGQVEQMAIGTTHSIALKLLMEEAKGTPLAARLRRILGTEGADESPIQYMRKILSGDFLEQLPGEKGVGDGESDPKEYLGVIGLLKNSLVPPGDLGAAREVLERTGRVRGGIDKLSRYIRAYVLYEALKKANHTADFDDMLTELYTLLRRSPERRAKLQERFKWALVDEAQDNSRAQHELARILAVHRPEPGAPGRNIVLVGDDYQSIYSWRGARPDYMLKFKETYPDAQVVVLGTNYRSVPSVVTLGAHVVSFNQNQLHKALTAHRPQAAVPPPSVHEHLDRREEAKWVVETSAGYKEAGVPLGEIAVLYRTNAQAAELELEYIRRRIPYVVEAGSSFYKRQEIADALAYLRLPAGLLTGRAADEAFKRIYNRPNRYLGNVYLDGLVASRVPGQTLLDAAREYSPGNRWARGHRELLETLDEIARAETLPAKWAIVYHFYDAFLRKGVPSEEDNDRRENLTSFGQIVGAFDGELKDLDAFLRVAETARAQRAAVRLMTFHRAKGLEFQCVFLVGVEDQVLPHKASKDREEERRLLYVGVTRAKDRLHLSYTGEAPSPFLKETGLVPPVGSEPKE